MPAHRNPVDDKTRGARKRYGARAALWGLMTALYAAGRDEEAGRLQDALRRKRSPDDVLADGLGFPNLGRTGEELIGWVASRYHAAEKKMDAAERINLEYMLPRAAYSIMKWAQRARPRPNLFDMSVKDAYEKAKDWLAKSEAGIPRQGPVAYTWEDGWTVQDLNTKALLVDEGDHQDICVGQDVNGYPGRVAAGAIKIYSLRDPTGRPHVTMTWGAIKGIYESSTKDNGYVTDDDLLRRCKEFTEHIDGPESASAQMFESACARASAIAESFDEDNWVDSLGQSWDVEEEEFDDNYCIVGSEHIQLQHPVMDVAKFRELKKKKSIERIAREVAENGGFYSDRATDVFERAFYYLESAIDAADRIKESLKKVATHVCDREWDDASRELQSLANFEDSNWGDTSSETDEMTGVIQMYKD